MKEASNNPLIASNNSSSTNQPPVSMPVLWTLALVRWVGYGLLVLSVLDFVHVLIPLKLMNPSWEFQTFGILIERVPLPLLGLTLIFLGREIGRNRRERWLLRFLSAFSLVLAMVYLLLIPLGIIDTTRLLRQNNQQITTQVEQRMAQIEQFQSALKQAQTQAQVEQLLQALGNKNPLPPLKSSQELQDAKQKIATAVNDGAKRMKSEADAARSAQQLSLLKNSVKWNLGALVAGVLLIIIWRSTYPWTK